MLANLANDGVVLLGEYHEKERILAFFIVLVHSYHYPLTSGTE